NVAGLAHEVGFLPRALVEGFAMVGTAKEIVGVVLGGRRGWKAHDAGDDQDERVSHDYSSTRSFCVKRWPSTFSSTVYSPGATISALRKSFHKSQLTRCRPASLGPASRLIRRPKVSILSSLAGAGLLASRIVIDTSLAGALRW